MIDPISALESPTDDELLVDVADDFVRRHRAGEHPSVDEYATMHPRLADRIRALLPAVLAMELPYVEATVEFGPPAERVGSIINRYKLLERLGEGGFGVVYMAEQQHPIRRKVALKVIKPGFDTRQVIARFEAERQALALMDHENIAKVLDAGATNSGHPYFVMELVHGVPITRFCDKNQLPTRERLELFVQVCRAVQHAHTKGIIHRDIKPSNVLVTLHEGDPVPKVIDFGVAKATGQQLTEKTLFTNFAQMVGTPLYMSPEQAEMTSIDVDTRSDVYSLGVLLYELLTGTTPLDKDQLQKAAFDEVRRIIREEEPPRPSTRLSTLGEQARSISMRRGSDPNRLSQLVRGELDWIIMKAIDKERARRYETPSALSRDIERYLHDEPVEACPPSPWYRFRKFARRRKALLGTLSGIAFLIVASGILLTVSHLKVADALRQQTASKAELETALQRERDVNERERRNSYIQRIALANREWSANNLSGMDKLLAACPEDLQGWEWHYLKRLRYRAPQPFRHDSPVLSVAFCPDGQYLAAGTQDGYVQIWEATSGRLCQKWRANQLTVHSVAFSRDGRYLAAGGWDGVVKVWEMNRVLQGKVSDPQLHLEHSSIVRSIAISPDSGRLAVASGRDPKRFGELKIWNLKSRRAEFTQEFSAQVDCVEFSPDGHRIATVDAGTLTLWDAHTGREQLICRDEDGALKGVAFSPDGLHLATVGGGIGVHPDRDIKIWDAGTGREVQSLRGHVGGLRAVAFSPDGTRLASCGLDQTVKIWDTASGQEILTLRGHLDNVYCVAFSADGRQLASGSVDKTVRIWDAGPSESESASEHLTLNGHIGAATDVAFHPTDGSTLVSAGTDGKVRVWNIRSGEKMGTLDVPSYWSVKLAYSPSGRHLAVLSRASDRTVVTIWDLANLKLTNSLHSQSGMDMCVAFSPDGQYVASSGMASEGMAFDVRVWEVGTGKRLSVVPQHTWPIFGVVFSPNGRYLASCSSDSTVRISDWANNQSLHVLEPRHAGRVASVAYSRDGKQLASASWDRTIKVWDSATWKLLDEVSDPTGGVLCVAYGQNRRLAWGSTDSTLKVWDGQGTETHILRGHTSWIQAVAISPDGNWIASASLDGTVKVWNAPPKLATTIPGPGIQDK